MPDHIHVLATLGTTRSLDRAVARFKAKTRRILEEQGMRWQPNYYEHRLRETDTVEAVLRYIFLNAYRAGLVAPNASYAWFWLGVPEAKWFEPTLDDGKPFAEWLR